MQRVYKPTIILISVATTALCALPLMSTYLSDGECCTMFIRGYNLMEFGAWGCVPTFASLFIPVILFGRQTEGAKEAELILLFAGNMVCYMHGFNASCEWLRSLDGSLLTYYPGMMLYLCFFITTWTLAWLYNRGHDNKREFDRNEVLVLNE